MAYIGFAPTNKPLTANDFQTGSITSAAIAEGAVISSKIADANVLTSKIALANVTSELIANANVRTADIELANVTTELLIDDAVTSSKIAPLINLQEDALITASAAIANVSINVLENSIRYFTGNNDKDFCINIRGNDSTTLNSLLETGNSISTVCLVTNSGTAFFASNTQVDNVAVVPKVQGGVQLSAGNANSTDVYTITVLKTGDAAFTMLLSQSEFS